MPRRALLLLGVVGSMLAILFGCIRVPSIRELVPPPPAQPADAPAGGTASPPQLPQAGETPATPTPAPTTLAQAQAWLAAAKGRLDAGLAYVATAKAEVATRARQALDLQRQAVADRIVRDGWWVFAAGIVATVIGVVCVAKNYGVGGWWVLGAGIATSLLGLGLVWLGPYWLPIVRWSVGVTALAFVLGAWWAWRHRSKLKKGLL